jgi:hypothetical protein
MQEIKREHVAGNNDFVTSIQISLICQLARHIIRLTTVARHIIRVFFFENIQTDLHSGTTTCRSANLWHMPHNMHLIIRVTSKAEYNNQCVAEHIS